MNHVPAVHSQNTTCSKHASSLLSLCTSTARLYWHSGLWASKAAKHVCWRLSVLQAYERWQLPELRALGSSYSSLPLPNFTGERNAKTASFVYCAWFVQEVRKVMSSNIQRVWFKLKDAISTSPQCHQTCFAVQYRGRPNCPTTALMPASLVLLCAYLM